MVTAARFAAGIGVVRWVAVLGGIGFWLVHVVALAALVPAACEEPGVEWVMHALTLVLGAAAVWAFVVCWRLVSAVDGAEGAVAHRTRFLGRFGAITAASNLVLILAEAAVVLPLDPCT